MSTAPFDSDVSLEEELTTVALVALKRVETNPLDTSSDLKASKSNLEFMIKASADNRSIRYALLSKQSIKVVTKTLGRLTSRPFSQVLARDVASCISACCYYIGVYMLSMDGVMWITIALEAQLLPALLRCEPWFRTLQSTDPQGHHILLISRQLSPYLVYLSVVHCCEKSLRQISELGLGKPTSCAVSPFWDAWRAFQARVEEVLEFKRTLEPSKTPRSICKYEKCFKPDTKHNFKRCGRCFAAFYCSVECQKLDWKGPSGHRQMCKTLETWRKEGTTFRLSTRDNNFAASISQLDFEKNKDISRIVMSRGITTPAIEFNYAFYPLVPKVESATSWVPPDYHKYEADKRDWDNLVRITERQGHGHGILVAHIPGGESHFTVYCSIRILVVHS